MKDNNESPEKGVKTETMHSTELHRFAHNTALEVGRNMDESGSRQAIKQMIILGAQWQSRQKTGISECLEAFINSYYTGCSKDELNQLRINGEKAIKEAHLQPANNDYVVKSELLEVLEYMCGYTDFPERKEGQGVYYWRTILREKFEEIGVSFTNDDFEKAMHVNPANNDYAVKVITDELQKYKEIQAETNINNDYAKARLEEGINLLSRLLTKFTPNN